MDPIAQFIYSKDIYSSNTGLIRFNRGCGCLWFIPNAVPTAQRRVFDVTSSSAINRSYRGGCIGMLWSCLWCCLACDGLCGECACIYEQYCY